MCTFASEEEYLLSMAVAVTVAEPKEKDTSIELFDINWDDVLLPKIAVHLSLQDLFNFRCCSREAKRFVNNALEYVHKVNLAGNNNKSVEHAFIIISANCCRLRELHLARCYWLNDDLLLPLLKRNTRLEIVNLNECVNISPLAIQPVIIACKKLRVLKLSKCHWLSSGAIDALTLHHSNLVEFDISYCSAISERCLMIFFRKLNKLNILSLANSHSVTDQVLQTISNYCRSLEHINLVGCTAITDYGIQTLINGCNRLQSMMVQRCPRVSERVLAPLRGRLHIDRPTLSYNLPALVNCLYLQV